VREQQRARQPLIVQQHRGQARRIAKHPQRSIDG
jgi:hypothetical protein